MTILFLFTIIFIFITILLESINLILQLQGRKLSKWFGAKAFNIHAIIVVALWLLTSGFIVILQFENYPRYHKNELLHYLGLVLLVCGLALASWGFKILGLKRSLCLNFFEDNIPVIQSSLYKYIKNPEDIGLWSALLGLALATGSLYNLIIAIEFILLMIPHQWLENRPLRPS